MNDTKTPAGDPQPGRYGAGYGETGPREMPQPAPGTEPATIETAGSEPVDREDGAGRHDDSGEPVVFTPDDVGIRPPDHPPTDAAPESEKAGLIFERS